MNIAQVNYLNVALIMLSALIALFLPFELVLIAYAVLGPLHFLTEIYWLKKRNFFSPGKHDYLLFFFITIIVVLPNVYNALYIRLAKHDAAGHVVINNTLQTIYFHLVSLRTLMMFFGFACAATMFITSDFRKRVISFVVIAFVAVLCRHFGFITVLFAVYVPTLIHVFVFTAAFMLVGALRNQGRSGYIAFTALIICALLLFVVPVSISALPTSTIVGRYHINFEYLSRDIFSSILHKNATTNDIYFSSTGVLISRFISFSYTYHYLNWFSKTTVIKWHKVPIRQNVAILLVWLFSVSLYTYNVKVGLLFLYFLGTLHVVYEFPLNVQSIKEIASRIGFY